MSLVNVGLCEWPRMSGDMATNIATFVFDAANDLATAIIQIPASGDIDNIHYNIQSNATLLGTLSISVQTVDLTTGKASGTNYKTHTTVTTTTFTVGNYSANVAITSAVAGDLVAVVFKLTAYTSGNASMAYRLGVLGAQNFPYRTQDTGAGDGLNTNGNMMFSVEYSGGVFYPIQGDPICLSGCTSANVSTTNPTSRGNIFRLPFGARAIGVWASCDTDSCTFSLRNSGGTKLTGCLVSSAGALDKDVRASNSTGIMRYLFDAGATATLVANTDYIVSIDGVDATTSSIRFMTTVAVGHFAQFPGGADCYGYTYSGSWAAANTTRYFIGIIYDQIDVSAGGGGLAANPVRGFVS